MIDYEKYPWLCPTTGRYEPGCYNKDTGNRVSEGESNNAEAVTTDAYGTYGLKLVYYKISHSTTSVDETGTYDPIYGEDQLQMVERSFYFNGYTEKIPPNVRTYQLQGIWGEDLVQVFVGKTAFKYWSTYGGKDKNTPEVFEDFEPRIGDVVYFPANDTFYEIRDVKYFSEAFGLASHTYTLTLKVYKDCKYTIDTTNETLQDQSDPIYNVATSALNSAIQTEDVLKLNDVVKNLKEEDDFYQTDVMWEDKNKGEVRIDPFDGWN